MDRQEYRGRLAGRLRGARAESGLSQKQVEVATGIDTSRAIELEDLLLERFLEVGAPA